VERTSVQVGDGRTASGAFERGPAQAALWTAALLFAFLPVLADLVRHLVLSPWARYAAIFPFLFVRCALRDRKRGAAAATGPDAALWIVAGLAIEAAAIFLGATRWGRAGALLAAVGLCRRFGWGTSRSQALLLAALPFPTAALREAQPLASHMQALVQTLLGDAYDPALSLGRYGSGLTLAALLAGLGWYAALLRDFPTRKALTLAAGLAVLAIPLQALALLLAALAAPQVGADAARAALLKALPLAVAAAGILLAELGARRSARS
jgi:hypothetical protein